ncbi:MAG TPA: hypothetical protein DDY14_11230 [Chromatiaceae bacterium]|nr:MAG: hypothetical protein N838_19505 [Thiohalocapsa sp. PB-PSB1]QQO53095.1 MAG: hypothetical protein N838_06680 [Thiohalocapsa sp. PB-PSB1]HBG95863.1 hypothetical protein [Chromatiaceae bacterium]HCS88934.1 hypothetical protein [Chromatiaceae bacterium]
MDFIDIYAGLTEAEREQYRRDYPEEAKTMTSFFQTRFEQIGERRGEQRGAATMLLLLLEDKFGFVPDQVKTEVEAASPDTLLLWSRRVLRANTIEEVLG